MNTSRVRFYRLFLVMLSVISCFCVLPLGISRADDGPLIKVVSPKADDVLLMGNKMKIRWRASAVSATHVRLELLRADGLCTVIDSKTRNDGKATWTIPRHLESDVNYAVRIIALTPGHTQGKSRGTFSIMGAGMP